MWIHIEGGDKLGGCVNKKSKGAHIYWPDMKTVNVERNIYINKTSVSHFEEENNQWIIKTSFDLSETMVIPNTTIAPDILQPSIQPLKPPKYQSTLVPSKSKSCPSHIWKPTQCVIDMMNSRKLPPGVQLPLIIQNDENILEGEGITD